MPSLGGTIQQRIYHASATSPKSRFLLQSRPKINVIAESAWCGHDTLNGGCEQLGTRTSFPKQRAVVQTVSTKTIECHCVDYRQWAARKTNSIKQRGLLRWFLDQYHASRWVLLCRSSCLKEV
jgi:hypothetical protein